MQNNLINAFEYNENRVRTVTKDGEPWFCLKDVCDILEIGNPRDVKNRLVGGDGVDTIDIISKGVMSTELPDSLGRMQKTTFISEPNLYKTIFQSRKPEAERFMDWLAKDVIPSIRKTGGYLDSKTINLLSNKVENLEEVIKIMLEQQIELNNDDKIVGKGDIKNRARILFVQKGYAIGDILEVFGNKVSRKSLFNWRKEENWNEMREDYFNKSKNFVVRLYDLLDKAITSAKKQPLPPRLFGVAKIIQSIKMLDEMTCPIPNTNEEMGLLLLTNQSS